MEYNTDKAKLILKKNGKSFYWAGKFLSEDYINRAAELYSFCRALDDIADSGNPTSLKHLTDIKLNINNNLHSEIENSYSIKYPQFFNVSSKKAAMDLIDGLILDQKSILFEDVSELIRYSYHVAGTVGIMMCDALKCENQDAKLFAIDLGIAMQMTNIARDVLEDAKMGRRYIPASWIGNISPEDIVSAVKKNDKKKYDTISQGIKKLLTLADKYYISGAMGFRYLPFKTRMAISIASGVYRQIGIQLKRNNYNWYHGRQVTSIPTKLRITIIKIIEEIFRRKVFTQHQLELHKFLKELI
jgi:phytoene synthase